MVQMKFVTEELQATTTTLQHLAEGACYSREVQASPSTVPDYVKGFKTVFTKKDFNVLLEYYYWDHAIEFFPGLEPKSSKVYPLSSIEQKELNTFLKENLYTKWIQPFKSSMATPVFFIKKKNGLLCLVQDYCSLNAMMIKNKYPFLLISKLVL